VDPAGQPVLERLPGLLHLSGLPRHRVLRHQLDQLPHRGRLHLLGQLRRLVLPIRSGLLRHRDRPDLADPPGLVGLLGLVVLLDPPHLWVLPLRLDPRHLLVLGHHQHRPSRQLRGYLLGLVVLLGLVALRGRQHQWGLLHHPGLPRL